MAVKIKLKRLGKIHAPYYRIVVADARTKRDGRAIEEIGKYHPKAEPSYIEVVSERAQYWLSVGAQPTEPVRRLLEITGDWQKFRGQPGAEGTLRTAAPKTGKGERFAEAVSQTKGANAEAKAGTEPQKAKSRAKSEARDKAEPKAGGKAEGKAEAKTEGRAETKKKPAGTRTAKPVKAADEAKPAADAKAGDEAKPAAEAKPAGGAEAGAEATDGSAEAKPAAVAEAGAEAADGSAKAEPAEAGPAEVEPAEVEPAEAEPAEAKPAAEAADGSAEAGSGG